MGLIADLIPLNLEAEKQQYFARGGNYNPQFVYSREFSDKKMHNYGYPQESFYQLAVAHLQTHAKNPKPRSEPVLTWPQIEAQVHDLCAQLNITPIKVVAAKQQGSRFAVTTSGELSVGWPLEITASHLQTVLNHEIQTHYLRRLNDAKQPWHEQTVSRVRKWKRTEEGLAVYNSKGDNNTDLRSTAHLYTMVYQAQSHDFATIYRLNLDFFHDQEHAFSQTLRVKRGLTDTSQPGGFTKDIVYWEGYLQVKDWLADPAHQLKDLYWGKIGTQEVEELRPIAVTTGLIYPTFIKN